MPAHIDLLTDSLLLVVFAPLHSKHAVIVKDYLHQMTTAKQPAFAAAAAARESKESAAGGGAGSAPAAAAVAGMSFLEQHIAAVSTQGSRRRGIIRHVVRLPMPCFLTAHCLTFALGFTDSD